MAVHEYLRILVIDCKIVTYEYFMDDMQEWEISMLMRMSHEAHRTAWETARYITYYNAVMGGKLKKKYVEKPMTELFPLPYDPQVEHNYSISNEEVDVLRERGNILAKKLFDKKHKK